MARRSRTVAVIASLVVVGGWLALRAGEGSAPAMSPAQAGPTAAPAAPARVRPARVAPAEIGALDPAMLSADALRQSLEDYEAASVYPPTSQRYTEDNAWELDAWNRPIVSDLSLDDRPGQETMYRFSADRTHVGFGDALTSTIEVWPVARPAERLPVEIRSAVVVSAARGRTGVSLAYHDDGQDGDAKADDHVYTNRFVPSEMDELARAQRVRISAGVEAGGVSTLMTLDFTYTPRPLLDLDGVAAEVRDGSLGISLAVVAHEPGLYLLAAAVLSADGTPIGQVQTGWTELHEGAQTVALSLFGRVLRDAGVPGPYLIRGVRATRHDTDDEVEAWWSDGRTFRTDRFALEAFSDAPWDSPERRETIATIQRSIDEEEAAERGATSE